jgi:hypothetical protein
MRATLVTRTGERGLHHHPALGHRGAAPANFPEPSRFNF